MNNYSIYLLDLNYKSVTTTLTEHLSFIISIKVIHRYNKPFSVSNSRDETINI